MRGTEKKKVSRISRVGRSEISNISVRLALTATNQRKDKSEIKISVILLVNLRKNEFIAENVQYCA